MRTGPATSTFANIVAVTAKKGRPDRWTPAPQQDRRKPESGPPLAPAREAAGALSAGAKFTPGQLLFAQLAGQGSQTVSRPHRQAVAAYPSMPSSYQIIAPTMPLSRPRTAVPGKSLLDYEI